MFKTAMTVAGSKGYNNRSGGRETEGTPQEDLVTDDAKKDMKSLVSATCNTVI